MLPATATRVTEHTDEDVNARIRRVTEDNVDCYARQGPEAIARRLGELDREWDIERTLETNFAVVTLIGIGLGELVDRRWRLVPAVAAGFMLQHALQGWCPPLSIFRRLGVRTAREIDDERHALKARLGHFQPAGPGSRLA